jgi:hypothetical protein
VSLFSKFGEGWPYPNTLFEKCAGTQMQARAWTYANARVVEHISLMATISDCRQKFIELKFEDRLCVADAVVLEHRLGLTKAANFVAEVDPWCYPHDDSPATVGVKDYVKSVVNKAAHAMNKILDFTMKASPNFFFLLFSQSRVIDLLCSSQVQGTTKYLISNNRCQRQPKQ